MNYKIPLFDLNFGIEEETAVLETIRSKWISMGPRTEEFESVFASMLGVPYAVAVSNCTVALHLAMVLAGVTEGDEVICPSLTFVATVNAIRYVRAIPVFCDITSPEELTLNPDLLESLLTPRTKAIVVMHYAGFSCEMDKITAIAEKHNLKVIEDACHGPLSEYKGRKLGTIGETGCFSFFSNKNISTGEGGMLVTGHQDLYKRAKLLRSHGMTSLSYERSRGHSTSYDVVELGFNYRMDDIRASIGIAQLKKLKADLDKRAKIRQLYIEGLTGMEGIFLPFKNYQGFSSNYIFPVVLKDSTVKQRDQIREAIHSAGIQTSVHYPAVHRFTMYQAYKYYLPVTEYVTDNEITLPMHGHLTGEQITYIVDTMKALIT